MTGPAGGYGPRMPFAGIAASVFAFVTFRAAGYPGGESVPAPPYRIRLFFAACAFLVAAASLAFTWYSARFHGRARSREFALEALFGVRGLRRFLPAWTGFLAGTAAADAAGLAAAAVLNRWFALVLGYLTGGRGPLDMPIDGRVLAGAVLLAVLQAAASALALGRSVREARPDSLFRSAPPAGGRSSRVRTATGLAVLALGIAAALGADRRSGLSSLAAALAGVSIGTFLALEGVLAAFFRILPRCRARSLPGARLSAALLVSLPRPFAAALSIAALFTAVAGTAAGSVFTLSSNARIQVDRTCPNGIELGSRDPGAIAAAAQRIHRSAPGEPESRVRFREVRSVLSLLAAPGSDSPVPAGAIPFSAWKGILEDSGREVPAEPRPGEMIGTGYFASIADSRNPFPTELFLEGGPRLPRSLRIVPEAYVLSASEVLRQVVLRDEDWDVFAAAAPPEAFHWSALWNAPSPDLLRPMEEATGPARDDFAAAGVSVRLRSREIEDFRKAAAGMVFIGVLLQSAFLALALSAALLQLRLNLPEDRDRLGILESIGTRSRDAEAALRARVLAILAVPAVLGSVYTLLALRMLSRISGFVVLPSAAASLVLTSLVYGSVYPILASRYRDAATDR